MKRVIMAAVHAKGKYARLFCEDAGRAIALVYVQVDDQDAFYGPAMEEVVGCHGKIIQQAEAFTSVGKGVVGPPGDVERYTVVKGMAAAVDGALCDHQFPACEGGRLRESDVTLLFWGQSLVQQLVQVFAC